MKHCSSGIEQKRTAPKVGKVHYDTLAHIAKSMSLYAEEILSAKILNAKSWKMQEKEMTKGG